MSSRISMHSVAVTGSVKSLYYIQRNASTYQITRKVKSHKSNCFVVMRLCLAGFHSSLQDNSLFVFYHEKFYIHTMRNFNNEQAWEKFVNELEASEHKLVNPILI